jgi:hypothetical protein
MSAAADCRLANLLQKEKKSAIMMLVIVSTFMICWAPACVLYSVSKQIRQPLAYGNLKAAREIR